MIARLKKWLKIGGLAGAVLLVLALLLRNQIARIAIERLGSHFLENQVELDRIEIGWSTIRLQRLAVLEKRLSGVPQIRVEEVVVEPTVLAGLRTGKYLRAITVQSPELHLRFDAQGKLQSHFPASEPAEEKPLEVPSVPLESLTVSDASFFVHQSSRESLRIAGCSLGLRADKNLAVDLKIDDLLGSRFKLASRLKADTLAGKTSLVLEPLQLDPRRLCQLPLVPELVGEIPASSHLSIKARLEHPDEFFDLISHDAAAEICLSRSASTSSQLNTANSVDEMVHQFLTQKLGGELSLRAFKHAGRCSLVASGPISGGQVDMQAAVDLAAAKWPTQVQLDVSQIELGPIARLFQPGLPADATLSVAGLITGNKVGDDFRFEGGLRPVVDQIRYEQFLTSPVVAQLNCKGSLDTTTGQPTGVATAFIETEGIDLHSLQSFIPQHPLAGRIGLNVNASAPLRMSVSPSDIQARCEVTSAGIGFDDFASSPISVVASIADAEINIVANPTTIGPTAPNLWRTKGLPAVAGLSADSRVTFAASASCPLEQAADMATWKATATTDYQNVSVKGEAVADGRAIVHLDKGVARLKPTQVQWRDLVAQASAEVVVESPITGQCSFATSTINLVEVGAAASRIAGQPLELSGEAAAEGIATFDLEKNGFQANGYLTVDDCVAQGIRVGSSRLAWSANPRYFQLQSSSDRFLGGRYAVAASIKDLDWTTTTVAAECHDVEISRLAAPAELPFNVSGRISGKITASGVADLESLQVIGSGSIAGGSVGRLPYAVMIPEVSLSSGDINAAIESKLAGGDIAITGKSRLAEIIDWSDTKGEIQHLPVSLQVDSTPLAINQLLTVIDSSRQLRSLRGSIDLHLSRSETQIASGTLFDAIVSLQNISLGRSVLAHRVKADVQLTPTAAKLNQLSGKIAGGTLLGDAEVAFPGGLASLSASRGLSGRYRMSLANLNLRRLGTAVGSGADVTGLASVSAKGRIGPVITSAVRTKLSNVVASGLAIREVRVPIDAEYSPSSGRAAWHVRGGSVYTGGGSVTLASEGTFVGGRASMTAKAGIHRIDTAKLMRSGGVNAGIVDGEVLLRAKRARAPEDVVGGFDIHLSQLQGFELPGFDQLLQIVKMPSFTMNKLGEDDIAVVNGRIGGGLIHIDDATLSKSGILVMATGTSTLGGRLDMDVTAVTKPSGPADGILELADSPLMLAAPAPVALIAKANDLLKDRIFYIEVAGTTSKPALHVQPGKNLSQDALRIVLSSTLGGNATDMLVRRPSQNENR